MIPRFDVLVGGLHAERKAVDALAVGAATGQSLDDETALAGLWRSLTAGTSRIVETFSTSDRMGLAVTSRLGPPLQPIAERPLAVLERVLVAAQQKAVGYDFDASPSNITSVLKQALAAMGLACLPSRLPLLLVVAAHAARTPGATCSVRVGSQRVGEILYQTFTLHDATAWLGERLTLAQGNVANAWIDGKTHAEIAASCNISKRTVANHLAAVYQTLKVSGRLGLLSLLSAEYLAGRVFHQHCSSAHELMPIPAAHLRS